MTDFLSSPAIENRSAVENEGAVDAVLLTRYARQGSDDAFRVLATRYAALVYGTCRRTLGRDDLAEDAAQEVFVLLARKAGRLAGHPSVAGWLYTTARHVSRDLLRRERRRAEVERSVSPRPSDGSPVESGLDDALARLKGPEREILVRRYLYGEALAELGARLGISEDAARMRVNRALESLRGHLAQAGSAMPLERLAAGLLAAPPHVPARLVQRLASPPLLRPGLSPFPMLRVVPAIALGIFVVVRFVLPRVQTPVVPYKDPTRARTRPSTGAAASASKVPFPTKGVVSIPLRLKPDAMAKEVWGMSAFTLPLVRGKARIRIGGRTYTVWITEGAGGTTFRVDRNGDGVFTPEERLQLTPQEMKGSAGETVISRFTETTLRPRGRAALPVGFRIVPDGPPTIPDWMGAVVVAPGFAYVGRATFGGKSLRIGVTTVGSADEYLSVDRDGNGNAGDASTEQFRLDRAFLIDGRTYRARLVERGDRAILQIAPSSERVWGIWGSAPVRPAAPISAPAARRVGRPSSPD